MEFFNQAIDILKNLVMALGAGLGVWGVINLLEGSGRTTLRQNCSCAFMSTLTLNARISHQLLLP